jgi:hypothetical protein
MTKAKPKDPTGAKRQQALRGLKPRVEAYLTREEFAEVEALVVSGECANQADAVRKALHEKYLRFAKKRV